MAFLPPFLAAAAAGGGAAAGGASLATALTVGSAALTGVSALQQGYYQAAIAKNNAKIAEANAAAASEAGQREAMRSDREYAALRGEQAAAAAASGLDILGRTQLQTRSMTLRVGREQATDIRGRAQNEARQSLQEAANFRAEGRQAKTQGIVTAVGSALSIGKTLVTSRRTKNPFARRK